MNETSPFFSFVVLAFNRKLELIKTIHRILSACEFSPEVSYEIIVIDNGSTDNTFEFLQESFPKADLLHVVRLEKNTGITGWNHGAMIAKGQYLWFLDDDSYPLQESVKAAFTELKGKHIKAAACRVMHRPGASGLMLPETQNHQEVKTFCGCGFILKAGLFTQLAGFWSGIFVYAHEKEFAVRLYNIGVPIIYLYDVVVEHDAAARLTQGKYYHTFKSTTLIYLRYLSPASATLLIISFLCRHILSISPIFYKASFRGVKDALVVARSGNIDRIRLNQATRKKYFFSLS